MRRALVAVLTVVCLGVMAAAPAHAGDGDQDDKVQAQQHYKAGLRAYNIGDFDRAISEWKTAYQFLGVADFLFNIAQAYRQKRDYEEAVFFYNAYLRGKPDAPNVAEVTALRDEMKTLREQELKNGQMAPEPKELLGPDGKRTEVPPAPGNSNQSSQGAAAPESTAPINGGITPTDGVKTELVRGRSDGRTLRITGIALGAAGVAFAATGVAFALSASSTESQLERAASNQEAWSDEFADLEDSADRNANLGTLLIAAGAASAIAGGVSYFLGHRKSEPARSHAGLQVLPRLSSDGGGARAGISLGMDF